MEPYHAIIITYKNFGENHHKRPLTCDKDIQIKFFGNWICTQQYNYITREQIMLNEKIYKIWTEFINSDKYKPYFISNEENWKTKLEEVKNYIDTNNKKPSGSDKNTLIKTLGMWIGSQSRNYKIKECIMSNEEIYKLWTEFINNDKYKPYF